MNFPKDFKQLKERISVIHRGLRNPSGLALGLICLCFVTAAADDWPSVLGPRGDGTSEEKLSLPWPAEGPERLWWKAVGEGYSSPIVAASRLFVFDRTGDEARLSAWDAASGRELWQARYQTRYEDYYGYSGGPRAAPLVDGERVFTYGVEGRLRAHAVSDGALFQAGLERRGAFFILGLDRHDKAPRTLVPPRSISELSDDAPGGTRGQ